MLSSRLVERIKSIYFVQFCEIICKMVLLNLLNLICLP